MCSDESSVVLLRWADMLAVITTVLTVERETRERHTREDLYSLDQFADCCLLCAPHIFILLLLLVVVVVVVVRTVVVVVVVVIIHG